MSEDAGDGVVHHGKLTSAAKDHQPARGYASDLDSGCISDGEPRTSEPQVIDFTNHDNRGLFERIKDSLVETSSGYEFLKTEHNPAATQDSTIQDVIFGLDDSGEDSQASHVDSVQEGIVMLPREPELRRLIQKYLSHGAIFLLNSLPADSQPLRCHWEYCIQCMTIEPGTLYLEFDRTCKIGSCDAPRPIRFSFHLRCHDHFLEIQYPLDTQEISCRSMGLDGVGHETVINAASRWCTSEVTVSQVVKTPTRPDFAWKHPYNSKEARELRSQKDLDIADTLKEVAKFERTKVEHFRESRGFSPDLLITPPSYLEPAGERYKKQGLTRHDLAVANQKRAEMRKISDSLEAVHDERALTNSLNQRHCYCFEEDDGQSDMIKCSSESCSVGWFHLRCTDLGRLPVIGEEFYCESCRDDFGPFKPVFGKQSGQTTGSVSSITTSDDEGNDADDDYDGEGEDDEHSEDEFDHDQSTINNEWDDSEEEDVDASTNEAEEGFAILNQALKTTPWGIPINSPEGIRLELQRMHREPRSLSPTRAPRDKRARLSYYQYD